MPSDGVYDVLYYQSSENNNQKYTTNICLQINTQSPLTDRLSQNSGF